ncbi:hypothetical protein ACM66B_005174 [Microbotryomycetes sp. NB124-2]
MSAAATSPPPPLPARGDRGNVQVAVVVPTTQRGSDKGRGASTGESSGDHDEADAVDNDDDDEEQDPFDEQAMLAKRKRTTFVAKQPTLSNTGKAASNLKAAATSHKNKRARQDDNIQEQEDQEDEEQDQRGAKVASSSLAVPTAAQPGRKSLASSLQPSQRQKPAKHDDESETRAAKRARGKEVPVQIRSPQKQAQKVSQQAKDSQAKGSKGSREMAKPPRKDDAAGRQKNGSGSGGGQLVPQVIIDHNAQPRASWQPTRYAQSDERSEEQDELEDAAGPSTTGNRKKPIDVEEANRRDNPRRPAVFTHMTEEGKWVADRVWFFPIFEPPSERNVLRNEVAANGGKVVDEMQEADIVVIPRGRVQTFRKTIKSAYQNQCLPVRQLWIEACLEGAAKSGIAWRFDPREYVTTVPTKRKQRQEFAEEELDALAKAYIKRIEGKCKNDGEAARYAFNKSKSTRHSFETFYKYFQRHQEQLSVRSRKFVKAQAREREHSESLARSDQPEQEKDEEEFDEVDSEDSNEAVEGLLTSHSKKRTQTGLGRELGDDDEGLLGSPGVRSRGPGAMLA